MSSGRTIFIHSLLFAKLKAEIVWTRNPKDNLYIVGKSITRLSLSQRKLSLSQSFTGIISKKPVLEVETGRDEGAVETKKGKSEESVSQKKSKSKPQALWISKIKVRNVLRSELSLNGVQKVMENQVKIPAKPSRPSHKSTPNKCVISTPSIHTHTHTHNLVLQGQLALFLFFKVTSNWREHSL
jgi:hypothetical protein